MVAGAADEIVEARALAAEDEDAVAGEVELVVVGCAALVESDDPEIAILELFEGADEVDDAGDAEMLGCSRAGFDGDGAEGRGAALGEDDAIDACAVGTRRSAPRFCGSSTPSRARTRRRAPGLMGSKRSSMARASCARTRATTP